MIIGQFIYSLIFPFLLGWMCMSVLLEPQYKMNVFAKVALAWGFGLGILSHLMLMIGWIGFQINFVNVSSVLGSVLVGLIFVWTKRKRQQKDKQIELFYLKPEKSIFDEPLLIKILHVMFWAMVIFYSKYIFWRAMNVPIHEWDSLASSIYNAKVFYFDGHLNKLEYLPYSIYPLHLPFMCVWTSLCLGFWDEQWVKLIFPVTFLAFSLFYYIFLRFWAGRTWAMLGTMMLFSSNLLIFHATITYREVFLASYTCSAVMMLMMWMHQQKRVFLIIASLLAGFAAFVKLEGVLYLLIQNLLVVYILFREFNVSNKERFKECLYFVVPCVGMFLIYYVYKMTHGISTVSYISPTVSNMFERSWHSLIKFKNALVYTSNWNVLWVWAVFASVMNVGVIRKSRSIQFLLLALIMFLGFHFSLSVLLGISSFILSQFTISRLLLHFFPILPLYLILLHCEVFKSAKSS